MSTQLCPHPTEVIFWYIRPKSKYGLHSNEASKAAALFQISNDVILLKPLNPKPMSSLATYTKRWKYVIDAY